MISLSAKGEKTFVSRFSICRDQSIFQVVPRRSVRNRKMDHTSFPLQVHPDTIASDHRLGLRTAEMAIGRADWHITTLNERSDFLPSHPHPFPSRPTPSIYRGFSLGGIDHFQLRTFLCLISTIIIIFPFDHPPSRHSSTHGYI
jgi:hypothetical protein